MARRSKHDFDDDNVVYDCALRMLALREHGGEDMYEKLLQKGATEEQSSAAVRRLKDAGLINEERYAMAVYRYWLNKGPYGREHLINTLALKKVEKTYWGQVLGLFTDEAELSKAKTAAELFIARYANKKFVNKRQLWAKAAGFMVNRGFGARYMEIIMNDFCAGDNNC